MAYDINTMLPGGVVVLGAQAIQQIIAMGDSDAALLYLSLLDNGVTDNLKWSDIRKGNAVKRLVDCGLISKAQSGQPGREPCPAAGGRPLQVSQTSSPVTPPLQVNPQHTSLPGHRRVLAECGVLHVSPPHAEQPIAPESPHVTQGEIVHDLCNKPGFPEALNAIEVCLGKRLSVIELQKSHQVYEAVNESPELLKVLLDWCEREQVRKYGEGHKPNMSGLLKEACVWARMGIDTPDAAQAYTQAQAVLYGREKDILRLLDIKPRNLIQQERDYISGWLKMGFEDSAIRLAYEKTVMKIQKLDWKYMDTILRSWHQEGRHTLEEVKSEPKRQTPGRAGGQQSRTPDKRAMEDMERMRRMMAQMKAEDAAAGRGTL